MLVNKGNIYLIGTSHIARESVQQVKETIEKIRPRIVAVELDAKRFTALMSKKRKISWKDVRYLGVKGFLFNLVGAAIERKLGKLVRTPPGSEIKAATESARQVNARIALIDRDIALTLKSLTRGLTWKEKFRFVKEVFLAMINKAPKMQFDLQKVPDTELILKLTTELKKKYPSAYRSLITERDEHMAKVLNKISMSYPQEKIVAVVGAGHVEGITQRLAEHGNIQ